MMPSLTSLNSQYHNINKQVGCYDYVYLPFLDFIMQDEGFTSKLKQYNEFDYNLLKCDYI